MLEANAPCRQASEPSVAMWTASGRKGADSRIKARR